MAFHLFRSAARSCLQTRYPCLVKTPINPHRVVVPIQIRNFKTSFPRRAVPLLGPILVKLTGPLYRLGFLLLGRRFRKFWNNLSPEIRAKYTKAFTKSKSRVYGGIFVCSGVSMVYYLSHLEETPVTRRKRFIIVDSRQLEDIASIQWRSIDDSLEKSKLPIYHPQHQKVFRIVKRIVMANQSKEVNQIKWQVNVIESDEVNAFVLANGQVYVHTGILNAMHNDNELAGVLGHEIAHAILNHSAEMLSMSGFFNVFSLVVLTLTWAFIPTDGTAFVVSLLQNMFEDLIINLPYSRKLEREADEVGLLLAARACYDIRYVPRFWHRMHVEQEGGVASGVVKWFSTHPTNESRVKHIDGLLPEALELRSYFECPELKEFYDASHRYREC